MAVCKVCFRHCDIREGERGFCGARACRNGAVVADNYGRVTSLALDPIEKKPLNDFYPGSRILSVGSYGCNLRCPFCQNHEISWSDQAFGFRETAHTVTPHELVSLAAENIPRGNIGIAFTYNEPLVGYEFVRDCAKLSHEQGMKNVLVTNGCASLSIFDELIPWIDAMNIDLKGFTDDYYSGLLGGNRQMVLDFISAAVRHCHVELTTLIIPGENDVDEEMRDICGFIKGLETENKKNIPLHITRFFPRFHMTDRDATDVMRLRNLTKIAREQLKIVYLGNC